MVSHPQDLAEEAGRHLGPCFELGRWGFRLSPDSPMQAGEGGPPAAPCPCQLRAPFLPTAAKIAGLYNDSEPPRKTMRRGVLMTLLQQSAMTLPLWIGKPGDK